MGGYSCFLFLFLAPIFSLCILLLPCPALRETRNDCEGVYVYWSGCEVLVDAEVERLPGDEQADDQPEEAEDRAEDFDDEDFDEAIRGA